MSPAPGSRGRCEASSSSPFPATLTREPAAMAMTAACWRNSPGRASRRSIWRCRAVFHIPQRRMTPPSAIFSARLLMAEDVALVDGLAYGALAEATIAAMRAPIVALCHHPLCLEAGLSSRPRRDAARERAPRPGARRPCDRHQRAYGRDAHPRLRPAPAQAHRRPAGDRSGAAGGRVRRRADAARRRLDHSAQGLSICWSRRSPASPISTGASP